MTVDPTDEDLGRQVGRLITAAVGDGRLGVAFSGGVDSSVLLALAARALGPARVVALLGVSASLATDERLAAHEVARVVGVPVVEVTTGGGRRSGLPGQRSRPLLLLQERALHPHLGRGRRRARARGRRVRRERRRRPPSRPPRRAGGPRARGAHPPRGRRARQGRRPPHRARPGAAVGGQAGRTVPGLADPALRGGHAAQARAGRGRRGGAARAGARRPPRPSPRGGGAGRGRRGRRRRGGGRPAARRRGRRRSCRPGSGT